MRCEDLLRYLSDYIDHDLNEDLRLEAEQHLASCHNCHVVLDTTRKTILLFHEKRRENLPPHINQALYARLEAIFGQHTGSEIVDGMNMR
jgi:anti-sigma factor RsiW